MGDAHCWRQDLNYIKLILSDGKEVYKAIRYVVVGIFSWVIDIAIFAWLQPLYGPVGAHTCSRIIGALFGFFGQKFFACQETTKDSHVIFGQSMGYFLLLCMSYLLSLGLLYFFHAVAGFSAIRSKIVAEVIVLPFNYFVTSKLIFKKR